LLNTNRIEEIEEFVSVFLDSQFMGRPGSIGDILLEVLNLKPVFNING